MIRKLISKLFGCPRCDSMQYSKLFDCCFDCNYPDNDY